MLRKTKIDDREMAWRARNADAAGIPIVFNHGAAGRKEIWTLVSRRLAEALPDRPIIFYDLPGHGESSPGGRTSIEQYAQDVLAFLDAENRTQIDLVGHSMGGAIAQVIASDHPERVRRLTLIGTGPVLGVTPILFELLPDRAEEAFGLMRQFAFGPDAPPLIVDAAIQQMVEGDAQVAYDDFKACDAWNAGERLAAIQAPTLVVVGEDDRLATAKLSRKLERGIAGARLTVLPRTGHMVPIERDRELSALLAEHMGE